ncbi:MAG TPA: AAA family ATPase, partial [Candidatus Limnocylindrales bacterium]|nr:AAA family ATPase [Candidatus Limnocylindrales bacterium]
MAVEIVGRDVELEAVSRLLASAAPGRRGLALSGEPGMGKTLLLREAIDRARDRGFRVLQAQGSETETGLTFVALHDLLSGIDEPRLGRLPPPQRRAMDIALRRLAPGDEGIDQGAVTIALLGILRDLAPDGPVLIAVDDVQWVDRSSAAVLGSALRRLTVEPVRVVATRRHDTSTGAIDGARDVVTDVEPALGGNVETIELRPLPLGALHHLIRARLGLSLARPALVQLHAATGGNPYFALEFARSIGPGVTSLAALDEIVPPDLRSLLAGRLKALPEATHRVVTAIAVASDATEATLCRALDLPGTELEAALEPAIGDGLVSRRGERVQLAHPLLASVARAEAAPSVRRDLHRRLAAVVGDPERAALHLAQATTGSNEGVAARLEEAALTARARGATMAALELYDRSIGLADAADRDALARRRVRRAEARFIAGDTAQAHRELAELLPTIADDNMRLEASLLLATIIWFDGSSHDAAEMAEQALATTDDRAWRARIHSRLAWMWEDDVERATSHARKALALLDPETEPGLYAFALLNAAEGDLQRGRSADHAAIARGHELQQHPQLWEFSTLPANWAKWMDQFDRTRELTEQYLARSRESGDESSVAQMLGYLAEVECWTGNLELAEHYADQAVETAEQTEQAVYLSAGLARRGLVRAYRGDLQGAGADGERALDLAESTASPQLTALALGLLGFVDL